MVETHAYESTREHTVLVTARGAREKLMSVKVNIHPLLGEYTNNQEAVEVIGSTVGECLEQLVAQFPGIREALFGKDGNLLNCIDIFVNADNAYPEELAKPVKDGDKLYIIMIMGCVG